MAVSCVKMTADAHMVCLTHALSTEKEEIMGLLIGEISEKRECLISAVIMLRRSDKQADRVEISPEQLSAASTHAEMLAHDLDRPMRVIGWYHSHPHITVWPSHVDVQTQAMYQLMDEGFIGLIYSVFNQEKTTKNNRVQVTCFQSINQSPEGEPAQWLRLEVPLHITPVECISQPCMESLMRLPQILSQEEEEAYTRATRAPNMDLVTKIHNGSVYSKNLCYIIEVLGGPLIQTLENRIEQNERRVKMLHQKKADLQKRIDEQKEKSQSETSPESPRKVTSV